MSVVLFITHSECQFEVSTQSKIDYYNGIKLKASSIIIFPK